WAAPRFFGFSRASERQLVAQEIEVCLRNAVSEQRVGQRSIAARQRLQRLLLVGTHVAHLRDQLALVLQECLGDLPTLPGRAYQVLLGNPDVIEEGLAERRVSTDELDRFDGDPRRLHVD